MGQERSAKARVATSEYWETLHESPRLALHATIYTSLAGQISPGWVLDLGCEYGLGSLLVAETNPKLHVLGMDVDLPALCYSFGGPADGGIPRVNADAYRLPLASESVAGVYVVNLLHMVQESGGIVSEVWRVLKSGGIGIISIPGEDGLADGPCGLRSVEQLAPRIEALFAEVIYPVEICGRIPSFPSQSFRLNQPTSPWIALCRKG
jgi:SAM-dependent methyltransferase